MYCGNEHVCYFTYMNFNLGPLQKGEVEKITFGWIFSIFRLIPYIIFHNIHKSTFNNSLRYISLTRRFL